ncbi:MAG: undecaprenyl-phosphate glucose phosphotransferase [Ignavibacteriales bacterium]|nr:undecaprenyl-phosphate glucose phosphotransferase [Ignavibacteriales bacterium]
MRHRKDFLIPLLTVLSDAVAIEFSFLVSYWLRFYSPLTGVFEVEKGFPPLTAYLEGSLVVIPVWLLLFNSRGLYSSRRNVGFSEESLAVVRAVFFGMLMVMAGAFFYRTFSYSRLVFGLLAVTSVVFISLGRFIVIKFEQWWYAQGKDLKRVIIVGTNETARRVHDDIMHNTRMGYSVVGFFAADGLQAMEGCSSEFIGPISEVPQYVKENSIDIVLIALDYKDHPKLYELVRDCEGLNAEMMMAPDLLELMTSRVGVYEFQGIPFIRIKNIPMTTWNLILKRAFDFTFALAVIILVSPLLLLIAFLIRLDSKGRALYRQERVGLDGTSFSVFKFRSMHVNAEHTSGPVWASKDDPRTTRVGRILRRFSLDELPQLFNVLKGDMSIVGPRPERPYFVEQFKEIPKYLDRHRVKTGMTGWAQVNGLRGNAPIEERTKYDVYYVENWTLAFDIKIILKTIRAVLFGKDAY